MHPLLAILEDAAEGRFPSADGTVEVLAPDGTGYLSVTALTGRAFVLADVHPAELSARGADGFGGALAPDVLRWLAGPDGVIGSVDVVLTTRARPGPPMARRDDVADHPRVVRAAAHRRDVDVYGDEAGLVVIGRGVAGRTELAVELFDATARSKGHGRRLLAAALGCRPEGERCWAQIAAGNAASLRSALAVGFVPIGAEVVIAPSS